MLRRLRRNSKLAKTVFTILLLGGAALTMMSIPQSSIDIRSVKSVRSWNELHDDDFFTTTSIVSETTTTTKGTFTIGYTEKNVPVVKIYDYIPVDETEDDKARKFDKAKAWLTSISETETKSESVQTCTNTTKKILWFDVWHNGSGIREQSRRVDFSKCECPCEMDYFFFNESETQKLYEPFGVDAVLLQINKLRGIDHPPVKGPGMVFVVAEREPPAAGGIPQQNYEYVFNWTMTFRGDSDIFYPYGEIVPREGQPPMKDYSAIYRRKKKGIIWFVSHCRTRTRREDYAQELRKYIDLDIIGKCGQDGVCPKGTKGCREKMEEDYFFGFNFENDFLTDYVTEKLFDNFYKDMIQIVGGAANYSAIAPKNTIIDVKNFESPKRLADYLKKVMSKEDLFTRHLKTKDRYQANGYQDMSQRAYCELCSKLHAPDSNRNLYFSIRDWFRDLNRKTM